MKDSKFTEAYLAIINEENESFSTEAQTADTADISAQTAADGEAQVICFKTSDKNLIDAINSGFDEVVFFVKAKDEATGEDTVQEVKFGPESFEDLEIKAGTENSTCSNCGEGDIENECGDGTPASGKQGGETIEGEDADGSVEGEDTGDGGSVEGEDIGDGGSVEGENTDGSVEGEDTLDETIDPSEWLEDGVCVKCGNPECDGTCKCKKCGSQNCIGDCEGSVEGEDADGDAGSDTGGDI